MKRVIIGSGNGLYARRQATTWIKALLISMGLSAIYPNEILSRNSIVFIQENVFQNTVCIVSTILFWPQYVKARRFWVTTPKLHQMCTMTVIHPIPIVYAQENWVINEEKDNFAQKI